jgi:hypothetical protein
MRETSVMKANTLKLQINMPIISKFIAIDDVEACFDHKLAPKHAW